jgi:CRISPR/Cas system-associated exonuclease Cas4 (RecB family)
MAILLRSVEEYRPHLEEALHRAGIPAYFARGATRPDPTGRALLALLGCLAEGYSAKRFAEYLSLGEVPDATAVGEPPPPREPSDRWVAPDEELVPDVIAAALETERDTEPEAAEPADADRRPVTDGTLRAPRRWEQLLVEAAVIGGRDRWEARLEGLANHYRLRLEGADEQHREHRAEDLERLESLRSFALPLLDALEELPERATWGEWLDALSSLASRALRRPERVLSVLAELAPMAEVGPVDLSDVRLVLADRLLTLAEPLPPSRHGRVFVAPADAARGFCFDVVCVPGLAERLFPRKISEEPLLLDAQRVRLPGLARNEDRVASERLLLRVAVGAAREALVLSYPRLDLDQSRPRVPSFYALEALRAAEGELPGFDELAARAEEVTAARVGWPAPDVAEDAIDEAEYDLAVLDRLLDRDEETVVGTARFLLDANPHLGRALRFRARRWLENWTEADGLTPHVQGDLASGAREAMLERRLPRERYSVTALEHFSQCPYRFLLKTIHRLKPREEPEPIDELDPLSRGSLFHDVQYKLSRELEDASLLPVTPENLLEARTHLDRILPEVADEYRDKLAPAIERVWRDGINTIGADLREWLRRASEDTSGYVPWRFELAFGLSDLTDRDPRSDPKPVELDSGLRLHGAIDLVERRADGRVRITDHKTGKVRVDEGGVISGGRALQPVLYALVAEKLLPEEEVVSGRLYYCTTTGGFAEREIPLDDLARRDARFVSEVVEAALTEPFLPAAPADKACNFCDYKIVCGPYEERRLKRKWKDHEQIKRLRQLREAR